MTDKILVSVIMCNYNYEKYLHEAITSVINQTYENFELIIVDDGSTDGSRKIIESYTDDRITPIFKSNGGQLSAFNEALTYITGDIVFFLDSDDIYRENYVEEILNAYKNNKEVDFIFCAYERFFTNGKKEFVQKYNEDIELGFSALSAIYLKEWVGSVTSTVSMKREVFDKILPIPLEEDWITRADDCLIWGSSMAGAKKYYCSKPLVLYRVHGENHFYGKYISNDNLYKRELAINKLFSYFFDKVGGKDFILNLISLEFKSRNPKSSKLFFTYLKIIFISKETFFIKLRKLLSILKIHLKKEK